jgi:hypothetical protein
MWQSGGSLSMRVCVVIGCALLAACARPYTASSVQQANTNNLPRCPTATVGIPQDAFESMPREQLVQVLHERGFLPSDEITHVIRYPAQFSLPLPSTAGTSGPRVLNRSEFEFRWQRLAQEGGGRAFLGDPERSWRRSWMRMG